MVYQVNIISDITYLHSRFDFDIISCFKKRLKFFHLYFKCDLKYNSMINGNIRNRFRIWVKALHIALSFFIYGYSLGVFNPCLENISYSLSWSHSEKKLYSNVLSTLIPIGALNGAIFTGYISSKIGRRNTIFLLGLIIITGSVLSMTHYTIAFGLGRFIV